MLQAKKKNEGSHDVTRTININPITTAPPSPLQPSNILPTPSFPYIPNQSWPLYYINMATISSPALTATVCTLEHRAWAALCSSGADLLPLLSTTPVMIFPNDMILTADSTPTLHEMLKDQSFKPWNSYTLSHDEVIPLGETGALIYYRVEAMREEEKFRAICSSAWVREGEEWKMASHQQTLI